VQTKPFNDKNGEKDLIRFSTRRNHRKGVAGILAALLMFAMVFTAGAGYFMAVNTYKHTSDQALVDRLDSLGQAAEENLSLRVRVISGGSIWLTVNNTGGVPVALEDIFVTNPLGKLVSNAQPPNSPSSYLSKSPDLNVTLPFTLSPGASSSEIRGCATVVGCDIKVSSASFGGGTSAFLLSVLTAQGNIFSVQYPTPQAGTLKNVIIVNQNFVTQVNAGNTVVNWYNQSSIVNCYGCTTNLNAGGNILVLQIIASPSPVSDGATISVTGTVWNYSPFTASGINLTLTAQYAGSASVTPDISGSFAKCGTTTSLPAGASAPFTCTFVAKTSGGSTGGTVTFSGKAVACILTGTTSTCQGGSLATSALTTSNPIQVGTIVSFGPWQLNYYYFTYSDLTHQTPGSPAIISSSDQYVALYVQLTNIYNSSMTILDGSYLQFVSPGSDVNQYVVENNTISYTTNSFTAYGCVDSPPSAPLDLVSGQHCITVNPGQTITLAFAADAPASTSWDWGSGGSPSGAANVGCTVQIIIEYNLKSSGSYYIYAENIPFQSVFIS